MDIDDKYIVGATLQLEIPAAGERKKCCESCPSTRAKVMHQRKPTHRSLRSLEVLPPRLRITTLKLTHLSGFTHYWASQLLPWQLHPLLGRSQMPQYPTCPRANYRAAGDHSAKCWDTRERRIRE